MGAPGYANGQINEGRAFLFLGSAAGLSGTPAWTKEGDSTGALFARSLAPAGDVNGDGVVNGTGSGPLATDDVSFFIEHWLDERRVNGFLTGDLMSRTTMGDLNFDGRTSLADWSILRGAHASGASLDLGALLGTSVPEPSTILLGALGVLLACSARRARLERA